MIQPTLSMCNSYRLFASAILTVTNQIWFCFACKPDHSIVLGYSIVRHKFISRTEAEAMTNNKPERAEIARAGPIINNSNNSNLTLAPEDGLSHAHSNPHSVTPACVVPLLAPVHTSTQRTRNMMYRLVAEASHQIT